jgi:hypothetical protein
MFRRLIAFALPLAVCAGIALTPDKAQAQGPINVGQLLSGLINVNVSNVDVDVVDVVDVSNVLNNNQVDILRNAIQHNPIASNNQNVLNNLLREADIIDDVTVVVGVLSGQRVLVLPAP